MINPFKEINWRPAGPDLRKFAWSLVIGFPCLALVFFLIGWIRAGHLPDPGKFAVLGAGGAAAGILCLLAPLVARPLYFVWYGVTACIGLVMSNLILTIIYYAVFTPIACVRRWLGRDPLRRKFHRGTPTYWQDAPEPAPASDYFRQY